MSARSTSSEDGGNESERKTGAAAPGAAAKRPLIYSHRCLGFGHPENSLRGLRDALASRVDGIEFDVRLTKDHKWVTIHNPFFRSEERSVLRVHTKTYGQIKREVTLLDTMLALFATHSDGKRLMIDMKDVGEERQIVRMIQKYDLYNQVTVIAWEPEVLRRVHALDRDIKIGFSYIPIHSTLTFVKGTAKDRLSRHKVVMNFNAMHRFDERFSKGHTNQHYLSRIPDLPLTSIQVFSIFCSAKLVRRAHEKRMSVIAFVVNSRINAALLRRRGVDGILTNRPTTFLRV